MRRRPACVPFGSAVAYGLGSRAKPAQSRFEPLRCTWGHPVLAERVEVHVQPPRGGAADQVGPEALEQPGPPLEAHNAAHAVEEPAVHRQPAALAAGVLHLHARLDQVKRVKDRRCKEAGAGAGGELLHPAALHDARASIRASTADRRSQGDKTPTAAQTLKSRVTVWEESVGSSRVGIGDRHSGIVRLFESSRQCSLSYTYLLTYCV